MKRESGVYRLTSTTGEKVRSFMPHPLPPIPPIVWDDKLRECFAEASMALGKLDSITRLLPDPHLFIYAYIRKEAVLSSQIEGTQSSLSELLLHEHRELKGVPLDDVREVSQYVKALYYGMNRLKDDFPLSLRLIRDIHSVMLQSGRGSFSSPGEFRRSQNWVGGSRPGNASYVPPPPELLMDALGNLEKFLHDTPARTPPLEKAALAHVQFETIHPFLDGNGRIGRLLITLILCVEGALQAPLLYLSLYFKKNRSEYYQRLQNVRTDGDWEGWLEFFGIGVKETCENAVETAMRLIKIFENDKEEVRKRFPSHANSLLRVLEALSNKLVATAPEIATETGLSYPTVSASLKKLQAIGISNNITSQKRNRVFAYPKYIDTLNEGIDV